MKHLSYPMALCLLMLGASGCITPDPGPRSRFYQLQPAVKEAQTDPLSADTVVSVGPIELSPYLSHPQIATRVTEHEVTYDELQRWAEPLRKNISATVCENLVTALGTDNVHPYTSVSTSDNPVSIPVRILRLEKRAAGEVLLHATWSVIAPGPNSKAVVRHARIDKPVLAAGMEYVVAAQSELLAELSQLIAKDIVAHAQSGSPND